jgi:hypothetical protein
MRECLRIIDYDSYISLSMYLIQSYYGWTLCRMHPVIYSWPVYRKDSLLRQLFTSQVFTIRLAVCCMLSSRASTVHKHMLSRYIDFVTTDILDEPWTF